MSDNNLAPTGDEFSKKVLAINGGQRMKSRREEKRAAQTLANIQRAADHDAAMEQIRLTRAMAHQAGRSALTNQAIQEVISLTEIEEQVRQAAPMAAVRTAAVVNSFVAASQLLIVRY
jgi:hypothetical protein